MSGPTWWQTWHGSPFPGSTGGGGGSTAMSTGVSQALSSKADGSWVTSTASGLAAQISTKAPGSHGHTISECTGLESTLAGLASQISTKAAGSHGHVTSEITNLDSTLAGLASQISTKAAGSHGHVIGDVTNLASTLSAISALVATKADSTHTHPGGGSGIPSTWVVLSTHVLTGSTTRQNVAGLGFALSSASVYRVDYFLCWQTISSATGIALGLNGPAAPTVVVYNVHMSSGLGVPQGRTGRAFDVQTLASPGSSAANLNEFASISGVIRTGANAGTLQPQFMSEVAGSTVSVRGGSIGLLWGPL